MLTVISIEYLLVPPPHSPKLVPGLCVLLVCVWCVKCLKETRRQIWIGLKSEVKYLMISFVAKPAIRLTVVRHRILQLYPET